MLERYGVFAGVGMRGLQAHQAGMQGIVHRACKSQFRDRTIDLLQGRHQAIANKGIEREDGHGAGKAVALRHQIQHHQHYAAKVDGF